MPNYIKKPQHDYVKPIRQKEVDRGRELDSGSLIAFSLLHRALDLLIS